MNKTEWISKWHVRAPRSDWAVFVNA